MYGLIGEEREGTFNTYHFDYRGSTIAITNENCAVTDRFEYDTYGRLTYRTGSTDVIFMYNGRDGVISDTNGLIYMRARYYSTSFLRFINADILHGNISDSTSLNRYAYVNGNPVSFVDPFGLSPEIEQHDPLNLDEIHNALKSLENKGQTSDVFVRVLEKLLGFRDAFSASDSFAFEIQLGDTTIFYEFGYSIGDGIFDLSKIAAGQLDLIGSIPFPENKNTTLNISGNSIGLSTSFDIDDCTSISATITANYLNQCPLIIL